MKTMITQHGIHYYWSVIPPILSQVGPNYGKAPTHAEAEKAIRRYCAAAATEVFDAAFQFGSNACYAPVNDSVR